MTKQGHLWCAFITNARVGWQQEGNWAHPVLYLLFALLAPISGVLMLVFMYLVVKGDSTEMSFLMFLLGGSAMFMFIRMVIAGMAFAIIEDREHYKILRYVYIAPVYLPVQIAGRAVGRALIALVGSIATITAGYLFLDVPFRPDGILWLHLMLSYAIGIIGVFVAGWFLASTMLLVDRMGWVWAEGISGLLFLASGAIIPMSILPQPFVWFGRILPMTYWTDIIRLSLYGNATTLAQPQLGINELWLYFSISTLIMTILAFVWHTIADRRARQTGMIERETFY